jgi:two-component system cell cycle sensor histidine kinase/response regulator CckA
MKSEADPPPPSEPCRLLLVEDVAADAELIVAELRRAGFAVTSQRVDGEAALRHALHHFVPDVVLSDHTLPHFNAQDALRVVQTERPHTPVIIVTGSLDEETAAEYIKAGAADYVVKHRLHRLGPAVRRAIVTARDAVERKRAEEELRRTTQFLSHAQAIAHIGSWEWDIARDAITWSEETYRIFGLTPAQGPIALEQYLALIHPDDRDTVGGAVRQTRETGASFEIDHRIVHPDGSVHFLHSRGGVVVDATGRPVGMTGTVLDITARKHLEQQLFQAQKMEAVGQLAAGVAHDFNNLLTAILGSTDLLLESLPTGHPGREDAEETRKAALRAADLTRQLLAFSRQQVLAPRVLDLNEVVANMDRLLQRLLGEDIELRTVLTPNLGAVRADAGQLEQVIVNLAVNARDAMPGGGNLTIETMNVALEETYRAAHTVVVPGAYVMVAVSDSGTGMDAATQARVFEPFFTTKPKGQGTGLGLATAYGIVKQSGGYIWVYSEPGRGTTFKVYLPRVDAPAERVSPDPDSTASLRGSEAILLVEDQEEVRKLVRRMLESRGYHVLAAASGHDALRLTGQHAGTIDLLVTDVVMPGMSGREVALLLAPARPHMKVLYLSGYTDESIVRHGMLEPGIAFLQKPFTAEALARKVREVLDLARNA